MFGKLITGAGILMALSACDGTMKGAVRGTGQAVQFNYEQGMNSDSLTAVIDGESFQGKAIMKGATSTVATSTFGSGAVFGSTTTGAHDATLIGSSGSSLRCQLQYADSSGFTTAGGVGVCRHSDGRIIDIVW